LIVKVRKLLRARDNVFEGHMPYCMLFLYSAESEKIWFSNRLERGRRSRQWH